MIFLLDNYDSFTYNLAQLLYGLGHKVEVARNDELSAAAVLERKPDCIVLSPGPGRPEESGIMQELIGAALGKVPLFGVCLGMQGLGLHCGGEVGIAGELMHGKTCTISHDGKTAFTELPKRIEVMRYHSLALTKCPAEVLEVSATSDDGEIMAVRHLEQPMEGVQFHPESFATEHGAKMILNFLTNYGINS